MTKPLEGVRVVELASYVFVPAAAAILADWGADVVKVEHPRFGDPARHTAAWGVPNEVNGVSHLWEAVNRGKRTVSLDIAGEEGRELLMRLVDGSDVFLTNFLPAVRRKLRIEPDDVMARNPRIVYGRGSANGPRGAEAERGGFDGVTYWGRSGAAIGVTPPGSDYPLSMPGPGFGDLQSGTALAGAIGTALFQRERTGRGTVVDVSLLSAGLWAMGMSISGTSVLDVDDLPRQHHLAANNPLVNQYRTKDGHFVALGFMQADRYWPEFCVLVDKVDWLVDDRFTDSEARARNAAACIAMLDELVAERTLDEWCTLLAQQTGQWDVLRSPGELQYDEQARANGYVQRIEHGDGGKVVLVPAPAQFDQEAAILGKAPRHGADTDSVLGTLGVDGETLARLRADGVIG
jgi:crotonobetainyl-CoA:carnitine CoA-transferase CaiB-like acyl-CoA transferase